MFRWDDVFFREILCFWLTLLHRARAIVWTLMTAYYAVTVCFLPLRKNTV
ncbi:hypothetical protein ALQ80_200091 [Pseudomonas coronafaciens pv. oryzae]|nr:hypothetical protein ALQ80_200091 [Pseudomonas coronafaciens pv. oryzae]